LAPRDRFEPVVTLEADTRADGVTHEGREHDHNGSSAPHRYRRACSSVRDIAKALMVRGIKIKTVTGSTAWQGNMVAHLLAA